MYRSMLVIFIAILGASSTVNAKHIYLKKSFFGGWKYSTSDLKYESVGMSGDGLRFEMHENQDAVAEMQTYKNRKTWAMVTGIPGGFLVGWPLGAALAGRFETTEKTMLAVGAPFFIASIILEASGNKHLKKAVTIYNGEGPANLGLLPRDKYPVRMQGTVVSIALVQF